GEFALALWDGPAATLFAARDRFGIKPLFYAEHGGALLLASEAKALFAAGVPARWDHEALYQAVHLTVPHPDGPLSAGAHQRPPGHSLPASAAGVRVVRYWDFDYPQAGSAGAGPSDAEAAAAFRAALDEAVRLRLRADVPVGCYLSGGLDSCAVLGLAAAHCDRPIRAFTLTFDRPEYDEGALACEAAARAGAAFTPVPATHDDLADDFADAVGQAEALLVNAHGVAKYRLSRAVRGAGYKVVLTGEGADEILAGYPHFRRDLLLQGAPGQDPDEARRRVDELGASNPVSRGLLLPDGEAAPLAGVRAALGFVPSWMEANATTAFKLRGLFRDGWAAGRDA